MASRKKPGRKATLEAHLRMPWPQWQQKKRQEWAAVVRAINVFKFGAAYTPAGNDLFHIEQSLAQISEALEQDWISW